MEIENASFLRCFALFLRRFRVDVRVGFASWPVRAILDFGLRILDWRRRRWGSWRVPFEEGDGGRPRAGWLPRNAGIFLVSSRHLKTLLQIRGGGLCEVSSGVSCGCARTAGFGLRTAGLGVVGQAPVWSCMFPLVAARWKERVGVGAGEVEGRGGARSTTRNCEMKHAVLTFRMSAERNAGRGLR